MASNIVVTERAIKIGADFLKDGDSTIFARCREHRAISPRGDLLAGASLADMFNSAIRQQLIGIRAAVEVHLNCNRHSVSCCDPPLRLQRRLLAT